MREIGFEGAGIAAKDADHMVADFCGVDRRHPCGLPKQPGYEAAARRSRSCGALLGDRVAAIHDQALPGDVGGAGAGQPGNGGGDLGG